MHGIYYLIIVVGSTMNLTMASPTQLDDIQEKAEAVETQLGLVRTKLTGHSAAVEDNLADLHQKAVNLQTEKDKTDKRTLPAWTVVISRSTRGLSGQSTKYKAAFRKLIDDRLKTMGDIKEGRTLPESVAEYAKTALNIRDNQLNLEPSRRGYMMYQNAMKNLREVASQRVLEDEVNENETALRESTETANTIKTWAYVNLIVVAAVLLVLSLGFILWFCWVARRKRLEDAAHRQRAGIRDKRGSEMRIAGHVAEMVPLAPSAPPQHSELSATHHVLHHQTR